LLTFYERLTKLKEFGLTDYQARAYLALLELNISTANQIPAISRVPRTKIYGIMRQLHDKGLVQIIPETPLKYRAVPFKQYLERRVGQLREEAGDLERSVDTLAESFQLQSHEPDEQGKFEMFYGRRNVRDKLKDMYSNAKKYIVSIGNEHSPARIVRTTISVIEDLAKDKVKIDYGFPVNKSNIERVKRLAEFSTIKHIDRRPAMHFIVVDGLECMLVHRIPNDEDPVRGEDIAIWSNDNAIVKSMDDFAKDILAGGLNYNAYNLFKPTVANIATWLRELNIDFEECLEQLGEKLGVGIAENLKSKKLDPLIKEIINYWDMKNLGKIEIVKKKPLTISMENHMDCHQQPEIAKGQCKFIKRMVGTIIENKTGTKTELVETDCRPDKRTYCKYKINVNA
jgi:sugar-specific transcriptional regulator TrmB/predicted hydrocarbon binding protein